MLRVGEIRPKGPRGSCRRAKCDPGERRTRNLTSPQNHQRPSPLWRKPALWGGKPPPPQRWPLRRVRCLAGRSPLSRMVSHTAAGRPTRGRQRRTLLSMRQVPEFEAQQPAQREPSFDMQRTRRGCRHLRNPMSPQPLRRRSSRPASRSTTTPRATSRLKRLPNALATTGAAPWREFTPVRRQVRSSGLLEPLLGPLLDTCSPVSCINLASPSKGMRAWQRKPRSG